MVKLAMTDGDIRKHYSEMIGTPGERIKILAELNARSLSSTADVKPLIIEILGDLIPPLAGTKSRCNVELFQHLHKKGLSDKEISQHTGASLNTVIRWRKREDLDANKARRVEPTPEMLVQRRELYDQGLNDRQIAEIQGVSSDAVGKWRRGQDLTTNKTRRRRGQCG